MRIVALFIIMLSLLGCKFNEIDCGLAISCENVYYYYDKDTEIAYHYYLFDIKNDIDKNLVLKRNTMKNNKSDDNLETLELVFRTSEDTLKSNFVDSWFMSDKDFILWKNKTNKIIYYLETYEHKLIGKDIYISSLNDLHNDTLYYDKGVDTLQQKMSIEEALLLMKN